MLLWILLWWTNAEFFIAFLEFDVLDLCTFLDDIGISSAPINVDRNKEAIATSISIANGILHPDNPPTRKAGSIYINPLRN